MNTKEIDLSIIVPAYNTEAYIERCLTSLCGQDYDPSAFEVIVVDDESPDRLGDAVRRLQARYGNLSYVWETNGRQGKARNTGVRHARGRYIAFVDSDDCWLSPHVISTLIPLCDHYRLDILQSSSYSDIAAEADLEQVDIACSPVEVFGRDLYLQKGIVHFAVTFSFYRASVIRRIPFREGVFFEDLDYSYKSIWAVGRNGRIGKVDFPYYGYRANPLSVTRAPSLEAFRGNVNATVEVVRFLQECRDMESGTAKSCWQRVKNSIVGWIKASRHFPAADSLKTLNVIRGVFVIVWWEASFWEKLCLSALRWFPYPLLSFIRLLAMIKGIRTWKPKAQ